MKRNWDLLLHRFRWFSCQKNIHIMFLPPFFGGEFSIIFPSPQLLEGLRWFTSGSLFGRSKMVWNHCRPLASYHVRPFLSWRKNHCRPFGVCIGNFILDPFHPGNLFKGCQTHTKQPQSTTSSEEIKRNLVVIRRWWNGDVKIFSVMDCNGS